MKRFLSAVAIVPLVPIFVFSGVNLLIKFVINFFSGWRDSFSLFPLPLTVFSGITDSIFFWMILTFISYSGLEYCWENVKKNK